jgi:hypothetical protein
VNNNRLPLASESCLSLYFAGVADIAGATTIPADSDPYTTFIHSGHSKIPRSADTTTDREAAHLLAEDAVCVPSRRLRHIVQTLY